MFNRLLFCLLLLTVFTATATAKSNIIEIDHIVAIVNEDVITATELDRYIDTIKKQLAQSNTRLPPEPVLRRQALERLIQERLQLQLAGKHGIRVDDETINRVIENIARENRLSLAEFRNVLQRDGYRFNDFRNNIRNEITTSRLRQKVVASSINISEQEVDNFLARRQSAQDAQTRYHLAHILIALPEAASPEQIQAARGKAKGVLQQLKQGADFQQTAAAVSDGQYALKGGDLGWLEAGRVPSIFEDTVQQLAIGQLSELIRSPSGYHIIKLLEKDQQQQQHIVQQTLARHILIGTNQLQSDAEVQTRLQRLRERLLQGEDFAQLAQANSDDKASAADGGSLGWTSPGKLVPEFQEVMDKLTPGEISQPFRSRFGWHLVQVMARRQHDDTEQFARSQARKLLHDRKLQEATENWLRRLRDEAYVEYRLDR